MGSFWTGVQDTVVQLDRRQLGGLTADLAWLCPSHLLFSRCEPLEDLFLRVTGVETYVLIALGLT